MNLHISTGPHIRTKTDTRSLMLDVLIALLPAAGMAIYYWGYHAIHIMLVSVGCAVLSELIWQKAAKRPVRIGDLSAAVTGLLLALNMPSTVPLWVPAIGSVFAIVIVKQLFGGIGCNFLNPALAARAVLLTSWPKYMASALLPIRTLGETAAQTGGLGVDAVTAATPLSGASGWSLMDMFLGNIPGAIGEVCKAAILLGLLYLLVRKVISPVIPCVFVATAALFTWILGGDVLKDLLSGGLLFGAVFMATDYVTNPMLRRGQAIYAFGCGLICVLIRKLGAYPEGVTYAILLMNIATPLIDRSLKRRVYGHQKKGEVKQNV